MDFLASFRERDPDHRHRDSTRPREHGLDHPGLRDPRRHPAPDHPGLRDRQSHPFVRPPVQDPARDTASARAVPRRPRGAGARGGVSLAIGDKVTVMWVPERRQLCKAFVTELFQSGFRFQEGLNSSRLAPSKKWNPCTGYEPVSFGLEGSVWVRGWVEDDSPEASAMRVAWAL
jgi:hypothetical protein